MKDHIEPCKDDKVMILGITGIPAELHEALDELLAKHNITEYFTLGTWDGKKFVGEVPDNASHFKSGVVISPQPVIKSWKIKSVQTWSYIYECATAQEAMERHTHGEQSDDSWVVDEVVSMATNCKQGSFLDKTV
jgi:hypothetical protein